MDTRDVIARFEAERQALALMDHPNIPHVLDAGDTNLYRYVANSPLEATDPSGHVSLSEYAVKVKKIVLL